MRRTKSHLKVKSPFTDVRRVRVVRSAPRVDGAPYYYYVNETRTSRELRSGPNGHFSDAVISHTCSPRAFRWRENKNLCGRLCFSTHASSTHAGGGTLARPADSNRNRCVCARGSPRGHSSTDDRSRQECPPRPVPPTPRVRNPTRRDAIYIR